MSEGKETRKSKAIPLVIAVVVFAVILGILWGAKALADKKEADALKSMVSEDRVATLETIKKYTNNPTLNLYSMEVLYGYNLDNVTTTDARSTQEVMALAFEEAIPGASGAFEEPNFGCSAFTLVDADGTVRMGRNYDFKYDTSAMMVYSHPDNGYDSIATAALNNLGADDPDSSIEAKVACLATPFVILDGMNEKGLGVAVLTLDSEPTVQNTGKPTVTTTVLLRLLLDRAATTEEAVALVRSYDMLAVGGRDYHFYITDASGDGRVVEYDCDSPTRQVVVTPTSAVTNFYICHQDQVLPNQKNGVYGHGRERYDAIVSVMQEGGSKDVAWKALKAAAQEPNPESVTSNTQWSVVYDLTKLSAEFALHRDWDSIKSFTL